MNFTKGGKVCPANVLNQRTNFTDGDAILQAGPVCFCFLIANGALSCTERGQTQKHPKR
nr:MAG TPA: hypothetical protein [Caudoviricetes sp.]